MSIYRASSQRLFEKIKGFLLQCPADSTVKPFARLRKDLFEDTTLIFTVNNLRQNTMAGLGMYKGEVSIKLLSISRLLIYHICAVFLQQVQRLIAIIHIKGQDHYTFSALLDKFCYLASPIQILHDLECSGTHLKINNTDLLIYVLIAPGYFSSKCIPEILFCLIEILNCNADVIYIVYLYLFSHHFPPNCFSLQYA